MPLARKRFFIVLHWATGTFAQSPLDGPGPPRGIDEYAVHKTPRATPWLQQHPEHRVRYRQTRASWLNQVERVFADPINNHLRLGHVLQWRVIGEDNP